MATYYPQNELEEKIAEDMSMCKNIKLCKDCKWFVKAGWGLDNEKFSRCHNPNICYIEPVMGTVTPRFCDFMRQWGGKCGEEAKFWEPAPSKPKPWWRFW